MIKQIMLGYDSFGRDCQTVQRELSGAKSLEFKMINGRWTAVIRK